MYKVNENGKVEIDVAELQEMEKLILELVDLDPIVEDISYWIESEIVDKGELWAGDEDPHIDVPEIVETVLSERMDEVWKDYYNTKAPTVIYDEVWARLDWQHLFSLADEKEEEIREQINEYNEQKRNPLRYVGMSERDFL